MGDTLGRRRLGALLVGLVAIGGLALAPAARAAPAPPSPARLESFELASPLVDTATVGGTLEAKRTAPKVNVLLPEGYDSQPDREFPVLWLLHGANGGTDTWVRGAGTLGGIGELADGLGAVVVMPDGGTFGMYVDWWNGGQRGGPAWASFHLGLLKDTVEDRYRIRPERRWHAIAGISMGGQGALRYAALLPGYFGSVAGFSAALPDMQSPEAQGGLGLLAAAGGRAATYEAIYGPAGGAYARGNSARALSGNYEHTRMFLSSGNGVNCPQDPVGRDIALDIVTEFFIRGEQARFAAQAERAGAEVTTDYPPCGVHTFGVWDRAWELARTWGFFAPVPEAPRSWTYRTIQRTGEVWGLRYRFTEPPPTVVELERSGRLLEATGRGHITLDGGAGCRLELALPARVTLPSRCP